MLLTDKFYRTLANFWIVCGIIDSSMTFAASVSKINPKDAHVILVNQDPSENFQAGDAVCVRASGDMICGTVIKANSVSLIVRLSSTSELNRVQPGQEVIAYDARPSGNGSRSGGEYANRSKFAVSAELGGAGIYWSAVFSGRLGPAALNIGWGTMSVGGSTVDTSLSTSWNVFPIYLSILPSQGNHSIELLGGGTLIRAKVSASLEGESASTSGSGFLFGTGLGYRYWPVDRGFHFRITAYLFKFPSAVSYAGFSTWYPWAGLSIGVAI